MSNNPLAATLVSFATSAKQRKAAESEKKLKEEQLEAEKKSKVESERMDRFVDYFKREQKKAKDQGQYRFMVESYGLTMCQISQVVELVNATPGLKGKQEYFLTGSNETDSSLFIVVEFTE